MGTDVVEVHEESRYSCAIKVHHAMCTELRMFIDRILRLLPDIEAARPRCSAGIQALCLLQGAISKAKLLLQNCSESSRFYLAITCDATVSRFEKIRKQLEQSLCELQSMVPVKLELEITQIIDDLRRAVFVVESFEQEAGKVIRALLQKDEHILSSFGNSEIRIIQFAASRLHLASQKDLLIEKRSIKKMLDKVSDSDQSKRTILKYLHHLLRKHDKLVLEWQPHYPSIISDGSFSSEISDRRSTAGDRIDAESPLRQKMDKAKPDMLHSAVPPEEFKCPLSSRLMCDPVVIASGHTYERMFIERWFDDGNDTCPTTGTKLTNLSFVPNTDMRNLISKWCKEQGSNLYESTSQLSELGSLENSYNSFSSCGSLAGLHLQIDLSSLSLGSMDTSFNSDNFRSKTEGELGLSRLHTCTSSLEFKFFSSTSQIETDLLSDIDQLPWELQSTAIEDTQSYLDYHTRTHVPMTSKNFMEPVIGYLKAAVDREDMRGQIAGCRLILTGVRASRTATRCMEEDAYSLLASLLGTVMTKDLLAIFELAVERSCGTKLAQSGALNSILGILDNQCKEFHETAIRILYNVSLIEDPCLQKCLPLACILRLVPFLKDSSSAGHCVVILEQLLCAEEARILAVKTEGFIAAIIELLETGNYQEQEHSLSILMSLCSHYEEGCKLAIQEGIISYLCGIAVNGSERGKATASELLQLLTKFTDEVEQDPSYDDNVSRIPYKNPEDKKGSSKRNRYFSKFMKKR